MIQKKSIKGMRTIRSGCYGGEVLNMMVTENPTEKVTFQQNSRRGEGMNLQLLRKEHSKDRQKTCKGPEAGTFGVLVTARIGE